ncbi:MAG: hypothetical protein AB1645_00095 [Bacillota bacterium]
MRASAGTMVVVRGAGVGSRAGPAAGGGRRGSVLPTTAYLMVGERCVSDCAFCPQARGAASREDLLSRVNWPEVNEAGERSFWEGLARAAAEGRLRRACVQATSSRAVREAVRQVVTRLGEVSPGLPVCVSAAVEDLDGVREVLGWGAERVSLALDAATPELYARLKGGDFDSRLDLLAAAARRFPGRLGTHLISGLGETERDMVLLFQTLTDLGVTVGLFAFTPVPGTRLADRASPDLASYRRLQAALSLVRRAEARAEAMTFDGEGRLVGYGRPWDEVTRLLDGGEAFRTSGCPDCNRPYYNERPSGVLYNYPRPLSPAEAERALADARPHPVRDPAASASGRSAARRSAPARPEVWRLIVEDRPRPAAMNMAVDEAILLSHAGGTAPPTLRFYTWSPPAVSLGYFQDPERDVDREACRREGVSVVRRPTGGRAVLHDREVTYSVVVSTSVLPGSVVDTYRRLAEGLVLGLRELGLEAGLAPEKGALPPAELQGGACFEVPSSYEILVGGRKVVGSAQTRRGGVILQHGAIPLHLDAGRLARLLGLGSEAAGRIAARAAGLDEFGPEPSYEDVCRALTRGLATALDVRFVPEPLAPEETALAHTLARERYGLEGSSPARPRQDKGEHPCTISW